MSEEKAKGRELEELSKGVDYWNKWRRENFVIKPVLSGADLSRANLSEADLSGADLSRANLSGAGLRRADLRRADLRGADLREANLSGEAVSKVFQARSALLGGVRLSVGLIGANLSGADLREADLSGVYLYGNIRDDFKIDGVHCEYIFWDKEQRIPRNRNFAPTEFEKLFKPDLRIQAFIEAEETLKQIKEKYYKGSEVLEGKIKKFYEPKQAKVTIKNNLLTFGSLEGLIKVISDIEAISLQPVFKEWSLSETHREYRLLNLTISSPLLFDFVVDPAWLAVLIAALTGYRNIKENVPEIIRDSEFIIGKIIGLSENTRTLILTGIKLFLVL